MSMPVGAQRLVAGTTIVAAGLAALPLTAGLLDNRIDENWLLPIAAGSSLAIGAGVGAALPAALTATGSRAKAALVGAGATLGVATLGTLALFALITDR